MPGTAYKIIMGFVVLIAVVMLWIVLNNAVTEVATILNNVSVNGSTISAEHIARNNQMVAVFGGLLIFVVIAFALWVLKGTLSRGNEPYV